MDADDADGKSASSWSIDVSRTGVTTVKGGIAFAGAGIAGAVIAGVVIARAVIVRAGIAGAGIAGAGMAGAGMAGAGIARAVIVRAGIARAVIVRAGIARAGIAGAGIARAVIARAGILYLPCKCASLLHEDSAAHTVPGACFERIHVALQLNHSDFDTISHCDQSRIEFGAQYRLSRLIQITPALCQGRGVRWSRKPIGIELAHLPRKGLDLGNIRIDGRSCQLSWLSHNAQVGCANVFQLHQNMNFSMVVGEYQIAVTVATLYFRFDGERGKSMHKRAN